MEHSPLILIADDEPGGRATLEMILSGRGYRFVFAADGAEALAQARATIPDLILLDVMMPKLDGFAVCRQLRADPMLADVPVVLLTALDDRESRLQGIESGADDYLAKPVDRVELRARVQTITRLNRYRRLLGERKKFEQIAENAHDGYLLVNGDRILYANPQARRFLRLELSGELPSGSFVEIARRHYNLKPADAWAGWPGTEERRYLVQAAEGPKTALFLQVERVALPVNADGHQLIRLANVTEQLGFQRELWGFHAALSHKLRTPLNGLIGSLQCLVGQVEGMATDEIDEWVNVANDSAERLNQQINDILAYQGSVSRLGATGAGLTAGGLLEQVRQLAQEEAMDVTVAELPAAWAGLRLSLSVEAANAVFGELLVNARKFHPESRPRVTVALEAFPGEVRVRVGDNGVNVAPDRLHQVWTPYFQSEAGYTGEVRGMGLGLAMVASVIWERGGRCRMANQPDGPGVVVDIYLPQLAAAASNDSAPAPVAA